VEALPENSVEQYVKDGLEQQARYKDLMEKNNILLHKVFIQNEDGAELLSKWRDSLIMNPTLVAESTQFDAGMNEGEKRFIRNLITSIQSVEQNL
jgi:hypothetical protein